MEKDDEIDTLDGNSRVLLRDHFPGILPTGSKTGFPGRDEEVHSGFQETMERH